MLLANLSQDEGGFGEDQSNTSALFERSKTQRVKHDQNLEMQKDLIRISNIKQLLRLFRINLVDKVLEY